MRVFVVGGLLAVAGCTCTESKPKAPEAVAAPPRPAPPPPAAPTNVVTARWVQQQLSPTRMELVAQLDYGPTASALTVQLELPPQLQVTRGRTFFTLDPSPTPRAHAEVLSLSAPALPVQDLVLVVTAPGLTVREPYRFGRPGPPPPPP